MENRLLDDAEIRWCLNPSMKTNIMDEKINK